MKEKGFWKRALSLGEAPGYMSYDVAKWLVCLSVALGVTLIVSNLAALKIWKITLPITIPSANWLTKTFHWVDIPVDAGILLFPFSYIIGDLLVAVFGKRLANIASFAATIMGLVTVAILYGVKLLPDYPGVDNTAFNVVQNATGRIFLASVIGFAISQPVNNLVFDEIKCRAEAKFANRRYTDEEIQTERAKSDDTFQKKEIISSLIARLFDVIPFEIIAFLGILSFSEFVKQVIFAYVAGCLLEFILSFLNKHLANALKGRLMYYGGEDLNV